MRKFAVCHVLIKTKKQQHPRRTKGCHHGDKGCFYDRCAEHHPARNDTFRHPSWHVLAITMYSTRKNWNTLKRARIGLQRLQQIRAATTVFVLGGAAMAMAPVGSCWYILHTHINVLMMIMTYHDYDDDDVGNHDNNTSYIEHNITQQSI